MRYRMKGFPMAKVFYRGSDSALLAGANNFSSLISAGPVPLGLTPALATNYGTLNHYCPASLWC